LYISPLSGEKGGHHGQLQDFFGGRKRFEGGQKNGLATEVRAFANHSFIWLRVPDIKNLSERKMRILPDELKRAKSEVH